ncbi:hypothetical protein F2P79_008398 [Pimephales promelas]|nr:hypothetical protein F2P79_008398 [Pimephales promelas]
MNCRSQAQKELHFKMCLKMEVYALTSYKIVGVQLMMCHQFLHHSSLCLMNQIQTVQLTA